MKKKPNREEITDSLKIIAKSSLFVFLIFLFSKVLFYFYRIIIARIFGPEIYGVFSLATIIFLFTLSLASFGFYEGLLRFVPFYRGTRKINKIRYIIKLSIVTLIFSSVLFGSILYLSSEFISINIFHEPDLIIFLKILSFATPFYMIGSVFLCLIRGFEKIKTHSFISEFFQNFIRLIFLVLFIFFGLGSKAVIFSYFIGILIVFFVSYLYCKYKLPEIFKKYILKKELKKQTKKKFLSYSVPLIFSNILAIILGYIDSLAIGFFKDSSNVGFYNAAFPIATLMIFFPTLFLQILFPMINRGFSEKKIELVRELSKQIQKWILILNLPFFLLMFLFSGAFINLLFGSQYMVAEQSLRILSVGFLFYSFSMVLENLILMSGKSKIFLIDTISISALNFILNILLIPKYGIEGAAFSTTMSYVILNIILFWQVKHYVSVIPVRRKMFHIFISVTIPALILLYIKQFISINLTSMIILGLLFFLLYIFLIFITKSLDRNDFIILKAIKNKITRI